MKKKLTLFLPIISISMLFSAYAMAQTCNNAITKTTPDSRFSVNDDGTLIIDSKTGLSWMRCSVGQSWDEDTSSCTGTATRHSWPGALSVAKNVTFAGESDWRVPNIKALNSIVELACYSPAINETYFPNTVTYYYWSSSYNAYSSSYAWNVEFSHGSDDRDTLKYNNLFVRLVRGGQ
ncbi:MAG: hypothetical protein ACI9VT_002389 [Psychroserpens sp.]|jgi:hypothetical protein